MRDSISAARDPEWYLRLVDLAQDTTAIPLWSPEELQEIWAHQLNSSVIRCIEELSPVHALQCQSVCNAVTPRIQTMRDLITRADAPEQLLTMVAKWMQRALGDTDELLPRDISLALFNVAIVLARTRCNVNLINSSDGEIARRAAAVAQRAWLDDATRELMDVAATELGGVDSEDPT